MICTPLVVVLHTLAGFLLVVEASVLGMVSWGMFAAFLRTISKATLPRGFLNICFFVSWSLGGVETLFVVLTHTFLGCSQELLLVPRVSCLDLA